MTEITGITGYTYDKKNFPQYYDGSKLLYDNKGEIIDLSTLSDEEKSKYIGQNWNNTEQVKKQIGMEVDPESGRAWATEPVYEITRKDAAENVRSAYMNRLINAGVKPEAAKDMVLPKEIIDPYGNKTLDDTKFQALIDVEAKGLGSDTIWNMIQGIKKVGLWTGTELIDYLTGGLASKHIRKRGETLKEARIRFQQQTGEGIEQKAAPYVINQMNDLLGTDIDGTVPVEKAMELAFGFKDTSEIMAAQYEDILNLSPSQMDSFMNPEGSRRPGETIKSGSMKALEIALESSPFIVAIEAKGISTSLKMNDLFKKWLYKKFKKDKIDVTNSKSFNKALEGADGYVDEFIKEYNKGKPFKKFLNWWYKGRVKSGMTFEAAAENRVAATNLYKKISQQQVDIKKLREKLASGKGDAKKINAEIKKLQVSINRNSLSQVDYFMEGIPKYIREEGLSETGSFIGGAAFTELFQNTAGQMTGEIFGAFTPSLGLHQLVVGAGKVTNNIFARIADAAYSGFGQSFAELPLISHRKWLLGMGSSGDYPFLMRDPTSAGDTTLGIPKGYRQATKHEIAALNQTREGLRGLGVDLESEIITGMFQTLDEFKTVENALIASGMNEEDAFNMVKDSLGVMMSISPLQTFLRVQATKLKREDVLSIQGGVKKVIEINNANKQLDKKLAEIIQKLGGITGDYKGAADITNFVDGLNRVQATMKQSQLDFEHNFALEALDVMNFIIGGGDLSKMSKAQLQGNFLFMTEFLEGTQAGRAFLSGQNVTSIKEGFENLSKERVAKIRAILESNRSVREKFEETNAKIKNNLFVNKELRYKEFEEIKTELSTKLKTAGADRPIIDFTDLYIETKFSLRASPAMDDWAKIRLNRADRKMFNNIFEGPARRKVQAYFKKLQEIGEIPAGLNINDFMEETALKSGKDPNDFTALDLWDYFETQKRNTTAGRTWLSYRKLELNFDDAHKLKIGFDERINKVVGTDAPVIAQLQDGVNEVRSTIKEFISDSGDKELQDTYEKYNRFYNQEISARYKEGTLGKGLQVTSAMKINEDESIKNIKLGIEKYINVGALASGNIEVQLAAHRANKRIWGAPAPADYKTRKVFDDTTKKEVTLADSGVVDSDGWMWKEGADFDFLQAQVEAKVRLWFSTTKSATALRLGKEAAIEEAVVGTLKKEGIIVKDLADLSRLVNNLEVKVLSKDGTKVITKRLIDIDKIVDESIGYKSFLKDPKHRKMWKEVNDQFDTDLVKAKMEATHTVKSQLITLQYNMESIQNLSGTKTPIDFLNKYAANPSAFYDLRAQLTTVKKLAAAGDQPAGKVTYISSTGIKDANGKFIETQEAAEEAFDQMVKKIVMTGILDDITSGTANITDKVLRKDLYKAFSDPSGIKFKKDRIGRFKEGILNSKMITWAREGEKVSRDVVNLDSKKLYNNLLQAQDLLTKAQGNYPPILKEDEFNLLVEFATVLKKKQGLTDELPTQVHDLPKGFSLPSLVSRVYAISRQVISPKYVITEAGILRVRINNLNFINEVLENPASAETMLELLKHDIAKPISPDLNKRVYDMVVAIVAKEAVLDEGEIKGFLGEQMENLFAPTETLQ